MNSHSYLMLEAPCSDSKPDTPTGPFPASNYTMSGRKSASSTKKPTKYFVDMNQAHDGANQFNGPSLLTTEVAWNIFSRGK